jgi:hypothetical protein
MIILGTEKPFKSIIVKDENENDVRIDEGMKISFTTESGELISGKLTKISGSKDKMKLQIIPQDKQKEEIWSIVNIIDGSLKEDK